MKPDSHPPTPLIEPFYEVRYEYVYEGERYGMEVAHVRFPNLAAARADATRVNADDHEMLAKRHVDYRYLQSKATIWRVYHREERILFPA